MALRPSQEIKDDLLRFLAYVEGSLDRELTEEIGIAVSVAMISLIEKGISPIEGGGRFPAYKWAGMSRAFKKAGTSTRRQVRQLRLKAKLQAKRGNKRGARASREQANIIGGIMRRQQQAVAARYPYNTEEFRKGKKRVRPVNLTLSGKFLKALEYKVTGAAGRYGLEIGFFDPDEAVKEQGHREGANGQPERPVIPINREEFAQVIQNEIWKRVELALDRAVAKGQ